MFVVTTRVAMKFCLNLRCIHIPVDYKVDVVEHR